MSIGNEPAYPREHYGHSIGLTKRELFAAMAMQGLLANPGGPVQSSLESGWNPSVNCTCEDVALTAAEYADALLAQLSKEPGHEGG